MKRILLVASLVICSVSALASTGSSVVKTSGIDRITNGTSDHHDVNWANILYIKFSSTVSGALKSDCPNGVWINSADEQATYSLLMKAFESNYAIEIGYDTSKAPPSSSTGYCGIYKVAVMPNK